MTTRDFNIASLKLFHAVRINDKDDEPKLSLSSLVKYGIIPVNNSGIVTELNECLANLIIDIIGIKTSEWQSSFHKSWDKVATASIEQLIAEQIVHYFSTYGMEDLGFESLNYIPVEKILVDVDASLSKEFFTVVRLLTEEELKSEIINYIQSVNSPHKDSVEHIRHLLELIKDIDIESIKSFEIKTIYCDINNIVPSGCQDFLRLAVYKASIGSTSTIVKDNKTIELLKYFAKSSFAEKMFENADLKKLSESFYRFKPLFLAFKQNKKLANKINKIRRYAVNNHKPLNGFVVSNLMNLLSLNRKKDAIKVIEKADVKDLIKLINFAKYEIKAKDHIYNIRNGKVYIKVELEDKDTNIIRVGNLVWLHDFCKERLRLMLNNVYLGTVFYIPEAVDYVVPVSEKQMINVLPYGTKIVLPEEAKALCIGGHWFNQYRRIDLDFHLNSLNSSYGWNSNYRSSENDILFSGDMTDAPAPLGAVEAFRISSSLKDHCLLSVNVYNTEGEIPFDLLFTKDITHECDFNRHSKNMISAVINPSNAIAPKISLKIHKKEEIIGFYYNKSFILYGGEIGGGHRIPCKNLMKNVLNASFDKCNAMMSIKEFIEIAGGKIVSTVPENLNEYIDLSICNLTGTTLFDIVNAKKDNFPKKTVEMIKNNI